jgi:aminopeptidase YwaD
MCRNPVPFVVSFLLFYILPGEILFAQDEVQWLKDQVNILAGPGMDGRGYVDEGGEKAAVYINGKFDEFGLRSFDKSGNHYQSYTFPVNTFPGVVSLKLNHNTLEPGKDFMVHGSSRGINVADKQVRTIDLSTLRDTLAWDSLKNGFTANGAYLLKSIDRLMQLKKLSLRTLSGEFADGIYIIPMPKKLSWLVTTDTVGATLIYVADSVMPHKVKKMSAVIETKFIPVFPTQNVLGFVPGTEKPDSFIVFTAHYDHLGKMGEQTLFPGANDNASGTAMLLYLAKYYAAHPQKYSMAFMAFSGEEAGLVGSFYYVNYPLFPLQQIRFLVNMDMMGDATKGITVVNAPANPREFALLDSINMRNKYLPAIVKRDQTRNSDHYPFSDMGVNAVFVYTNGIKPYYHDIKDKPEEVNFENAPGVIKLMEDFVGAVQDSSSPYYPVSIPNPPVARVRGTQLARGG